MNARSPILLLGIGGAGVSTARGICRAFDGGLRCLLVDTDATSGDGDDNFILLGGDRLAGRGSGGDIVNARMATDESAQAIGAALEDVRLAVIVTSLGGGTGGGATFEIVRQLKSNGIPSIVFATTPFTFESTARQRNARGIMAMIEEEASATVFLQLDKLVGATDNMDDALDKAVETLTAGATLFWRLIHTPGYIRLDIERLRKIVSAGGRARFATVSVTGPDRASAAVEALVANPLLAHGTSPARSILCGILAGHDLLLSEVATVADGLRTAFGEECEFELSTVNDESTFSGKLAVVMILFESAISNDDEEDNNDSSATADGSASKPSKRQRSKPIPVLATGPKGRGRFKNAEPTVWNNEDLDVPTFIRRNISLDL